MERGQTWATMSNNKKAENEGGKEGRRWVHSVITNSLRSVNSQWKCTQSIGLNEARSSSLALWCAFPQVVDMLTELLSISWPDVWGFLCRVYRITNVFPAGAIFPSKSSLTHGETPAGTNVQRSSREAQLRFHERVLQRLNRQDKVLMCPCCKG